ncbi:NADH-quinone oxidoreductase subunit J [Acaryochloris marina]|uniref:NADH-quinone oxidoreductase subunit J n=1 Tax=Acaryochloris marina (strain MBIC 11017) TaxID=329726 RepID=B0BZW4_ACAM1|nr:NADH-quinone oxidoreductase subunit J [Acaryochloris marina]ABW27174.1 proton-translocating NAD(P)H-quinone oxidoreductase, chain J, putative [Acaryochloris marina MBIC11017]BDM81927.1 NADH:ubiquinone oxidoreductase subunit J [Acaryochloris marina MBIC10699]
MNLAEGVQLVSLILLSVMMLGAALGVVLFESIVYSAFTLGAVFISIAGLYILLNADFVSAAQILIYVGAVNVLILFAIMLVNKTEDFKPLPRRWIRKVSTAFVSLALFTLLATMVLQTNWPVDVALAPPASSVETIGIHFFTDYLLPFELASILLLMALVGAVVLARRETIIGEETAIVGEEPAPVLELPERPKEPVA